MEIKFFLRTEIDFLNIAKFQNLFLCSEKTESRNNHFHTCTFHYIKKYFERGYGQTGSEPYLGAVFLFFKIEL